MHLPASHLHLQRPSLFVNHTLRSFEVLQKPKEPGKHTQHEDFTTSDEQFSLSSDTTFPETDFFANSCTIASPDFTSPCPSVDASVGSMSRGSNDSHELKCASKSFGSVSLEEKNPSPSYNLEMYAPTAQFPGLQSSRLPVTNPSFEMARFLKSTGPGPSKQWIDRVDEKKRARAKYRFIVESVRKATKKLQLEEESTQTFKPPLVGVVQKVSQSGKYFCGSLLPCADIGKGIRYLQITTSASESEDYQSDHGDNRNSECTNVLPRSAHAEDLERWIADLRSAARVRIYEERILPTQNHTLKEGRLRTSQSLDFEPSEVQVDKKADNAGTASRNASFQPAHSVMEILRPRSSSLRGPPKTLILPLDTLSESTSSCTESEERLMDSPTFEDLRNTDFITMTYDESQDALEKPEKTACAGGLEINERKKEYDSFGMRKVACEDRSSLISAPLASNSSKENSIEIARKEDSGLMPDDSATVSRSSSDTSRAYSHKGRGAWVRQRKLKDLQNSCKRQHITNDGNQGLVRSKRNETSPADFGNEIKISNGNQESQVYKPPQKLVVHSKEPVKRSDNSPSSSQTRYLPAVQIAKEMNMSQHNPCHELIHPANRPGNAIEICKTATEIPIIEPMRKSGKENAKLEMVGETLPNSTYRAPRQVRSQPSSLPNTHAVPEGKNKPLPPIRQINNTALSTSNEETKTEMKMIKAIPASTAKKDKSKPNISSTQISSDTAATISSTLPASTSVSAPSSSSSSPSASAPLPTSTTSPIAQPLQPPPPPPPPLVPNSEGNHLEQRVKQLEHEKALLQTALAAVLNAAGTLHQ